MKILVNAASIKEGGSLVVLDQLLQRMPSLRADVEWAVAANPALQRRWREHANISRIDVGNTDAGPFGVLRWYELGLPAAVKRLQADLVFSVTNYLPLRALPVPTVLLVQHAGHFSLEFDTLTRQHLRRPDRVAAWRMKTAWVERSVRTASAVTVQTSALAQVIAAKTGRPCDRIHVIPHGPGAVTPASQARTKTAAKPVRIGYVTKWGVQKNFAVLFEAAARLIGESRPIRIVLTLTPQLPENRRVLRHAAAVGLDDAVENVGEVDAASISALYDTLDLFVFPSLVESFGFPLLEAMARGVPVVAADTPSNREIAGEAGVFFAPTDAEALAKRLAALIDDAPLRHARSAAALHRALDFSWERAAELTLELIDAAIEGKVGETDEAHDRTCGFETTAAGRKSRQ